jgi:hypothetical protein
MGRKKQMKHVIQTLKSQLESLKKNGVVDGPVTKEFIKQYEDAIGILTKEEAKREKKMKN